MDISLYPFQVEAVEGLRANFRSGSVNQILCAPTGAGKTVIGTFFLKEVQRRGKKALFIVDRLSLIEQTSAVLDRYGIDHGIIQGSHPRSRPHCKIQIATSQTLARRSGHWLKEWLQDVDLYLVDEAHSQYAYVLGLLGEKRTRAVGLTATPFTKGLGKYYESVVSVTTTNQLIETGFLSPYKVFAASEPDLTGVKVSRDGEWDSTEAAERSMPIIGDCVAEYLKHAHGKKFICFGVNVAHCTEIQRQFTSAGIPCGLYTYQDGDDERSAAVEEFRKPDSFLRGLISVSALAKGFDVQDVECVIIARPLRKSLSEHIQMIGRGLRKDPDNPSKVCCVLDHAGNVCRFWTETSEFFETGAVKLDDGTRKPKEKREASEKAPRKCPSCHHVHKPSLFCPACGFVYERRSEVVHVAGELSESKKARSVTLAEKQDFYSQLLGYARHYGKPKAEGWAAYRYRDRFGCWPPNGFHRESKSTSIEVQRWIQQRNIAYGKSKKTHTRAA